MHFLFSNGIVGLNIRIRVSKFEHAVRQKFRIEFHRCILVRSNDRYTCVKFIPRHEKVIDNFKSKTHGRPTKVCRMISLPFHFFVSSFLTSLAFPLLYFPLLGSYDRSQGTSIRARSSCGRTRGLYSYPSLDKQPTLATARTIIGEIKRTIHPVVSRSQ